MILQRENPFKFHNFDTQINSNNQIDYLSPTTKVFNYEKKQIH